MENKEPLLQGDTYFEKTQYFFKCLAIVVLIPFWVPLLFIGSGIVWAGILTGKFLKFLLEMSDWPDKYKCCLSLIHI